MSMLQKQQMGMADLCRAQYRGTGVLQINPPWIIFVSTLSGFQHHVRCRTQRRNVLSAVSHTGVRRW